MACLASDVLSWHLGPELLARMGLCTKVVRVMDSWTCAIGVCATHKTRSLSMSLSSVKTFLRSAHTLTVCVRCEKTF